MNQTFSSAEMQVCQIVVEALPIWGYYSTSWTAAAIQYIKRDPGGTF